jgi:hypothetical protein
METTTRLKPMTATLDIMRRLMAEKQAEQKKLREAFATDSDLKKMLADLDRRHADRNA